MFLKSVHLCYKDLGFLLWPTASLITWLITPTVPMAHRWLKKSCWFRHILLCSKHLEQFILPLKLSSSYALKLYRGIHGDDQGVIWVPLFTLKLHGLSVHKGRCPCTPYLPPAVSLVHWEASRKLLAESSVTTDVINCCSVLCHRYLQELLTWEIVHLQPSEKLLVEVLSHTKSKNTRPHIFIS